MDEVVAMLQRFKDSEDERDQAIFACMIHNLFDEYRFFHNYPDKELRITGILFGNLIKHQLISSWTLSMAIKYVLDALRRTPGNSPDGKIFKFGVYALEQFKACFFLCVFKLCVSSFLEHSHSNNTVHIVISSLVCPIFRTCAVISLPSRTWQSTSQSCILMFRFVWESF